MRCTCIIFLLLLNGLCLQAFYQNSDIRVTIEKALIDYQELSNESQVLLLERTLQKAEEHLESSDTTTIKVYSHLSDWFFKNKLFERSREFASLALDNIIELNESSVNIALAETRLAECHKWCYELIEAEKLYRSSLSKLAKVSHAQNFKNHIGLATICASEGNYDLQVKYANNAMAIANSAEQKCEALYYAFNGYARRGRIHECDSIVGVLLPTAKLTGSNYEIGRAYSQVALVEILKRDYQNAIKYYDKAVMTMAASDDYRKHRSISSAFTTMSNVYSRIGRPELAIQYAKKSIEESQSFFNKDYHPDIGINFHNLASKYAKAKDWEAALRYEQNAIKCFLKDPEFTDNGKTIPDNALRRVSVKWQLLLSLREKGLYYAHLYLEHKNKEDIINAEKHLGNAIQLIDIMRAEMETDNTKVYWSKKTRFIYDSAIEMCDWLQDLDCMQEYIEKSRSLILLDELNHKDALSMIPEELVEREKSLRGKMVDDQEVATIENYNRYLDSLKSSYPAYYKYKFETSAPSVEEIQEFIPYDSMQILQYYLTPDSLYTLSSTKQESRFYTQPAPKDFPARIDNLLNQLNNKDSLEYADVYEQFVNNSSDLYDILLGNIEHKHQHLVIVGDGIINYIPFEILVEDNPELSYAIESHSFSYAPSLAVLMKIEKYKDFDELLMVNPMSYGDDNLAALEVAREEANYLENISNLQLLESQEASLNNFKEKSKTVDVIHLSTHSGVNEKSGEPWIALNDSLIGLNDIIKLNLEASLVTLSSCSSLDGNNNDSEGINSLARAFLFADVSSVVGSLWELNEDAGYSILMDFYSGLKNGKNKSEALRDAKLEYIKTNKYKSPYYWAPLVIIGDADSLISEKTYSASVYLVLSLLVIAFLVYIQNRRA